MSRETLQYLNDFLEKPVIVKTQDLSDDVLGELPEWWKKCIEVSGQDRIDLVIEEWRQFENLLPITLTYLEHNLSEVIFICHEDSQLSMIYEFVFHKAEPSYYEGRVPFQKEAPANTVQHLPTGLKSFYTVLHNGWTEVASNALGPLPLEECYTLSESDWELDETFRISEFNLDKLLIVFNNGGSGYLCVDLIYPEDSCVIWWSDERPSRQQSFWAVLDSWIEIGFEEE